MALRISAFAIAAAGIFAFSVACLPAELRAPAPTFPPSPTATPSPTPFVVPSPAPSQILLPTPSPLPTFTDLEGTLRTLAVGWAPKGETVIVQQPAGLDGAVLTAVPLDAGQQPVPLLAFAAGADWDVRPSGSAIAISLARGLGTTRIAIWDARTGSTRWVTPDEPGVLQGSPVWSADGGFIFYSAIRPPDDLGIFRVTASGGAPSRIRAPEGFGGRLEGLTPDGRGLVWARNQAGSSTEVLDLRTGRNSGYPGGNSSGARWRSQQPRALLVVGNCCVGHRGTLVVWDDVTGEQRMIYGSELTPQEAVGSADWDPDGTRIVVSVFDTTTNSTMALTTMDEFGRARTPLAGTEGAVDVRWLDSGIVYFKVTEAGDGDMILLPPGGAPRAFFPVVYPGAWRVVAP